MKQRREASKGAKLRSNQKGFTLMELMIVMAVIGILGAMVIPGYSQITNKAKVVTDVSTTKTIKRLVDVYHAEGYTPLTGTSDAKAIGKALHEKGYLESATIELQTNGDLIYTSNTTEESLKLNLSGKKVPVGIMKILDKLDDQTNQWIHAGSTS